jgi:hypothetical protein
MSATLVKCNWCDKVTDEQDLILKSDTECCPQCGENNYLMDTEIPQ